MRIEPEISGVSIVLLGEFNPAIFTPAWFALHGLLPESVATSAELQVAHQQMTVFATDRLRLDVSPQRFLVETQQESYIHLCDLVVRVFKEHLYHTPLKAFGINRDVHFQVSSLTVRDQIGRKLAPMEPWGIWKCKLGLDSETGGMMSLTMASQVNPEGRPKGDRINITVAPSVQIDQGRWGVYVGVNDHYTTDNDAGSGASEHLMGLLEDHFDESLRRSDGIVDHIMSLSSE